MPNHNNDPLYNSVEDIFGADEEPEREQPRRPGRSQPQPQPIESYDDDDYIDDEIIDDEIIDEEPEQQQQIHIRRKPQRKIRFQDQDASSHVSIIEYISGISYMLVLMFVIIFIANIKQVKNFIIKNIDGIEYESMAMNAITTGLAVGLIGTCMGIQYYKSCWN
jgi:hypothetical protein